MNFDETTEDNIRQYLNQQMSDEARVAFEQQLQEQPELAVEVRHWREFRVVAQHRALLKEVAQWKAWGKEVDGSEPLNDEYLKLLNPKRNWWQRWRNWYLGTSSALLVIGMGYWGWQRYELKSISKRFMQPMPNFVAFAIGSDTTLLPLLRVYDSGRYDLVVRLFDSNIVLHEDETAKLYAGVSALLDEQYLKAIDLLAPLTGKGFYHSDKALYYMSLAELRMGKKPEARQIWLQLSANTHFKVKVDSLLQAFPQ
jgi:hypothetical protein